MKRLISLAAVVAVVVGVCGISGCGGESHESLASDAVATLKELTAVMENIKDEATATSARDKLKSLIEKLKAINERQAKLPAPSEAEIKSMRDKYEKEMEQLQLKLNGQMMRLRFDPKISKVLDGIDVKGTN